MDETVKRIFNEAEARANAAYAAEKHRITIDPVTRLEGHGRIDIHLDGRGDVEHAYFQVPELRGFEVFCRGRPAEDMPQITSRICGVCPTAHHIAAAKALDDLYQVRPPVAGRKIRELVYHAFMLEDHALHVFVLGGPDFIVGPDAPAAERNILGVIGKVGLDAGRKVIQTRRRLRELIASVGGKVVHPVLGLPGGVARALRPEDLPAIREVAVEALEFAQWTAGVFRDVVLANPDYLRMIRSEDYTHRTCYLGQVDENNAVNFYDGVLRVVDCEGREIDRFDARHYREHIAEHVEPWSFMKFTYLKARGWQGFVEGPETSVYSVGPLARLNAADCFSTPLAEQARAQFFATLGGRPVHHTLANHWARVVEMIHAAERLVELAYDPDLASAAVRTLPSAEPSVGMGVVEAPRGTLFHHYETDGRGIIRMANLVVATGNNASRIAMSVERAAKKLIHGGEVNDGLLNRVEMAFRAYDPCLGCATHALPGHMPLKVRIRSAGGAVVSELRQD